MANLESCVIYLQNEEIPPIACFIIRNNLLLSNGYLDIEVYKLLMEIPSIAQLYIKLLVIGT